MRLDDAAREKAKTKFFVEGSQKVIEFIDALQKNSVYQSAAPDKSSPVSITDLDSLEAAKATLTKPKSTFHAGMSIFPVGAFVCDAVSSKISQCRQDQLLAADIDAACEIARSFPDFTAESISKERDGDYDIGVPSQNKIYEMVAKIRLFDETASEHLKTSLQHEVSGVKDRISQLQSALLRTVALKFEKKFSCFSHSMGMVANGQQNEQNSASCMQMLNDMSTYQALPPKMSLVKLLGKEKATEVDTAVASITHLATLMHKAFPQVVQLTTSAATEGLLTNESVVALFASLHDSNIQKAFASAAPMWKSTIEDLDTFIQNCVAKTLVKATDTFHPFVLKLLGEIDVDSMLDAKVVGLPADGEAEEQESNVF